MYFVCRERTARESSTSGPAIHRSHHELFLIRRSWFSTRAPHRSGLFRLVVLTVTASLTAGAASGWNVFTHEFSGSQVQADQADGSVTLAGHDYPVDSRVNSAIVNWPSYYNAGVVGPDGYPDTAYGEVTIHPGNKADIDGKVAYGKPAPTGAWLSYLLDHAWAAQNDASYSADEKAQILAFTYGFLTHAAGDTWAHTLMNDYSGAVYPAIIDVLHSLPAAQMALRHLITEQYIGSTAPNFDSPNGEHDTAGCGSPDTAPPDTLCNTGTPDEKRVEVSPRARTMPTRPLRGRSARPKARVARTFRTSRRMPRRESPSTSRSASSNEPW